MINFSTAQEKFLSHLQSSSKVSKGYISPDTQRTYRRGLEDLAQHLLALGIDRLERVATEHLRSYLEALRDRGQAPATVALRRTIVASFFKWADSNYKHLEDVTKGLERTTLPRKEAAHMSWQQVLSLLDYLWRDRKARKRDALLFELLARTGARVAEASKTNLGDLTISDTQIALSLIGKGNKPRLISLQVSTDGIARFKSRLEDYLRRRLKRHASLGHEQALFLTNMGNRIRPRNIQAAFDYYRYRLNLQGFTPHSLRHAYLTHLLQQGVDVVTVSKLAGHSSPNITLSVYAHTDPDRLAAAAAKAFD
jgi:site-specific recombinase XerD